MKVYNNKYLLLYKRVYNNKQFYYTLKFILSYTPYIMTTNISLIHESDFSLYETMYNKNICFCYTRRCIMTINIFVIHEDV